MADISRLSGAPSGGKGKLPTWSCKKAAAAARFDTQADGGQHGPMNTES
jgi:hypothetical protein